MNSIDDHDRFRSGDGYEQNNESENFARYNWKLFFYSKGLKEEEIRNAFNSNFEIHLTKEEEEIFNKEYNVSDLIKFKNPRY